MSKPSHVDLSCAVLKVAFTIAALSTAGCIFPRKVDNFTFLCPGISFMRQTTNSVLNALEHPDFNIEALVLCNNGLSIASSRDELRSFFVDTHGLMSEDEWELALVDPFHNTLHTIVECGVAEPDKYGEFPPQEMLARDAIKYCVDRLTNDGWNEIRNGYATEMTLGSDWIRVFRRNCQLLKIQFPGPWIENVNLRTNGYFKVSSITFGLIHIEPAQLFGPEYMRDQRGY